MSLASEQIVVGSIGAPYGVKGWVKINSFTERPEDIFDYVPWLLGNNQNVTVEQWRTHNNGLVAKIEGCDSRDDAEVIKNAQITISESQLPPIDDGFYWKDLIGMRVKTQKGYDLGVISQMFNTGANDVMTIKANSNDAFGQKERLLPFVFDQVVIDVDQDQRVITVEWDPDF